MKCPDCQSSKLDIIPENQQRGIALRVYCTAIGCDYEGSTFVEEDTFTEDRPRLKMDAEGNLTQI